MALVSIFTDVKCISPEQFCCSRRLAAGSPGLSLKKGGPNGGRLAAMKFGSFHSLHGTICLWVTQTLLEGLSQVTVGVLLTINSLQVFFLDENVNAFLDHWDPRFEPGGQLSEDFTK